MMILTLCARGFFELDKLETISRMKLLYFILRIKKVKLSLLNIKLCIVISRDIL